MNLDTMRRVANFILATLLFVNVLIMLKTSMKSVRSKVYRIDEKLYDEKLQKKCFYGIFSDSLLVLNFNFPMYVHVELLIEMYADVFGRVVICGPHARQNEKHMEPDIVFDNEKGDFSYRCMTLAMQKYPGFKGYIYGNDDMVINWWTMVNHDRAKIWHGTKVVDFRQDAYGEIIRKDWIWWNTKLGIEACQKYYESLKSIAQSGGDAVVTSKNILGIYLKNGYGRPHCGKGWSDFFYIPGRFAESFIFLSTMAYENKLYLEIAVHNILRSLDMTENILVLDGIYLPDKGVFDYNSKAFWDTYNHQIAFIHPYKFHADQHQHSISLLKSKVILFKQQLTKC